MNDNRIVRVFNDKVHKMIVYVAKLTDSSYQHVFNVLLDYLIEGHVIGDMTHHVLIERVLRGKKQV